MLSLGVEMVVIVAEIRVLNVEDSGYKMVTTFTR
jgi:hypothetical protein